VEHGPIAVPLSELIVDGRLDIYPEVLEKDYFTIRLTGTELTFIASRYVGLIPINDRVQIEVWPRMPVASLTRMLSVSGVAPVTLDLIAQTYATADETFPSLLDLFAAALATALREVEAYGVYREYMSRRADTSIPKGRILFGETMRRHEVKGVRHRVVASWYERQSDNAPNQLLKYAVWYLAQQLLAERRSRKGVKQLCERLNEAHALFHGVSLWQDRRFLDSPLVKDPGRMPPLRAYYQRPMRIALAVVGAKGLSFDEPGSDVALSSLLLKLEDLFEAYLRNVLRGLLAGTGGLAVLDGNLGEPAGAKKLLFDAQPSPEAKPDIVLRRTGTNRPGENAILIEAKYKRYAEVDRDDLNQTITYAMSYRCPVAVVAHPWWEGCHQGLRELGRISSVAVYSYVVDLSAADLAQEEAAFADAMRSLAAR
jgi:5-methylcytosine-specific restriction enzyme subunit McrC